MIVITETQRKRVYSSIPAKIIGNRTRTEITHNILYSRDRFSVARIVETGRDDVIVDTVVKLTIATYHFYTIKTCNDRGRR